jgi:hypothetical protein
LPIFCHVLSLSVKDEVVNPKSDIRFQLMGAAATCYQ